MRSDRTKFSDKEATKRWTRLPRRQTQALNQQGIDPTPRQLLFARLGGKMACGSAVRPVGSRLLA
jgi:hypothetical protein